MKKIKLLFQGDSITHGFRNEDDCHDLGIRYVKFAAALIKDAYPDVEFEFINQGISGNRTCQLFDRLYTDAMAFEPDIVSILIGINDIWHRHGSSKIETTDAQVETNYRAILERLKNQTNAKIVILAPFLLDDENKEVWRPEVDKVLEIVRRLADEYADAYIPLDEHFAEALKTQPEPLYYSKDGVHPNENGRAFIGKLYAEAVKPLINSL